MRVRARVGVRVRATVRVYRAVSLTSAKSTNMLQPGTHLVRARDRARARVRARARARVRVRVSSECGEGARGDPPGGRA